MSSSPTNFVNASSRHRNDSSTTSKNRTVISFNQITLSNQKFKLLKGATAESIAAETNRSRSNSRHSRATGEAGYALKVIPVGQPDQPGHPDLSRMPKEMLDLYYLTREVGQ